MWAFLLLFSGIFAYYTRAKKDWYFVIGGAFIILIMMVLYTYSRSALLGMIAGVWVVLIWSLRFLYRRYRTQVISLMVIAGILVSALLVSYAGSWQAIIGRAGSTKGHFERMTTSIERWMAYPMGQWLASSGPAYRYIYDFGEKNRESIEKADAIYIPESWYIQQFVEWWWIGGLLFIAIMIVILVGLMQIHIILWGMYLAILVMNMFLHTFEASVLVLPLFLLIGLLLSPRSDDHIQ
jgi:O-Antigen ligase